MSFWLAAAGGALAAIALYYLLKLLRRFLERIVAQKEKYLAQLRRWQEERRGAEQAAREQQVRIILESKYDELKEELCRLAGIDAGELQDTSDDAELVRQIASRVSKNMLDLLQVAATQQEFDFQLETTRERIPVRYPTQDIEPTYMTDLTQLADVTPEQLVADDDIFYARMAQNQLQIMQAHETIVNQPLMYLLVDVSGSMADPMVGGTKRCNWAAGITVSLLLKAMRGEAMYLFRMFDEAPRPLHEVRTPEEARKLLRFILKSCLSEGGTSIFTAVSKAVKDIRKKGSDSTQRDVLLITDADDKSMNDTDSVQKLLGDDIRLHSAVIGASSPALKKVSKTYREFR